jgi:macrodomain Ter protein organizer (MatP/YcbG family)
VVDFSKSVSFGRGPVALERALDWSRAKRGRPKQGEKPAGTVTRSLRLPEAAWKALEQIAKRQGTTVHALIRQAITEKLTNAA